MRFVLISGLLGAVLRIGLPAGLESVMYNIANLTIQIFVNELGTDTVAAWGTMGKIDAVFWMVCNAFAISITTFVGQNYGAGKYKRVRDAFWFSIKSSFVVMSISAFIGITCSVHIVRNVPRRSGSPCNWHSRSSHPVLRPLLHATFPLWKHALPEHRQKRPGYLSVHDPERSGIHPRSLAHEHYSWTYRDPDIPDYLRCHFCCYYLAYGSKTSLKPCLKICRVFLPLCYN